MEPTIREGEVLLVNKVQYLLKEPKVGDIVVLKNPLREKGKKYIIKRIQKIQGDKFFVMGDNKRASVDSRRFGWINKKNILGKIFF